MKVTAARNMATQSQPSSESLPMGTQQGCLPLCQEPATFYIPLPEKGWPQHSAGRDWWAGVLSSPKYLCSQKCTDCMGCNMQKLAALNLWPLLHGSRGHTLVKAGNQLAILDEVVEINNCCSFLSFYAVQGSETTGCFSEGIWKWLSELEGNTLQRCLLVLQVQHRHWGHVAGGKGANHIYRQLLFQYWDQIMNSLG